MLWVPCAVGSIPTSSPSMGGLAQSVEQRYNYAVLLDIPRQSSWQNGGLLIRMSGVQVPPEEPDASVNDIYTEQPKRCSQRGLQTPKLNNLRIAIYTQRCGWGKKIAKGRRHGFES